MNRFSGYSVIAAALSTTIATPLYAQATGEELAEMRAQLQAMSDRVDHLENELATARAAGNIRADADAVREEADNGQPTQAISTLTKSDGWSFKPRGRLMFDAGFTRAPDSTDADDGFGNEVRRARLGASGDIPGGFGYKFEIDFAGNEVEVADAFLSYGDGPVDIVIGHHNNFQSLEELTSSLHTTFIERAAFTDAFGFQRRLGASISYANGSILAQGGVFTDNFDETSSKNRGADARLVFMPDVGDMQLHMGASMHYNDIDDPDATVRYRQRPLVHFTSERFVNTGNLDADSEFGYGLEAAMISGRVHAAAEGFWQEVDRPGSLPDPTFFGGYAEAGFFLTNDTRGYKAGKFDRTKPSNPVGEGGLGSLQLNLRYDYLDLNDANVVGGMQNGYLASLVWKPTAYTLIAVNYGHLEYEDAVIPLATGDTSYGVDAFGVRAQVDF